MQVQCTVGLIDVRMYLFIKSVAAFPASKTTSVCWQQMYA